MLDTTADRMVAGGLALGREPDGRIVLAEGALPGERVRVEVTERRRSLTRGVVVEVLDAGPDRVDPTCAHLRAGCGGCDLMFAAPTSQPELKRGIVQDALARIARMPDVVVDTGEVLAVEGFRTVLRGAVGPDGTLSLRARRSHDLIPVPMCLVAHPLLRSLLDGVVVAGEGDVLARVGARTGERMVVLGDGVEAVEVPEGVQVVRADGDGHLHELVGRRRFRISARSFFQARPDGAEALVRAVARALGATGPQLGNVVDLYGGVGLFTAGLDVRQGTLVERSRSSAADARVNLDRRDVAVHQVDVAEWTPVRADAVVADPPRAGLGPRGVAAVAATGAGRAALVSCDPAALARDVKDLVAAGYEVRGVELVDLFPHTHHVEAVTALERS